MTDVIRTSNELADIRKRAGKQAKAATTVTLWPKEWLAIDAEIERLRGYLAMWESNCTGHHGSQSSCGMTADNGVAPDRPAPETGGVERSHVSDARLQTMIDKPSSRDRHAALLELQRWRNGAAQKAAGDPE
jgi:hypothetical protein